MIKFMKKFYNKLNKKQKEYFNSLNKKQQIKYIFNSIGYDYNPDTENLKEINKPFTQHKFFPLLIFSSIVIFLFIFILIIK